MEIIPKVYLYNTSTKQKELLRPITPNRVTFYVCGPTLYDNPHIGNARPLIVFDVLFRLLQELYPEVIYVRNITDVDDKIITKAQALGISTEAVVDKFYQIFKKNLQALNILPPVHEPRATQHINEMVAIINLLLEKGYAYKKNGHVFFRVAQFSSYGSLSHRTQENTISGLGNDSIVKDIKEDYHDFVLWKPAVGGEIAWESPFGRGRPGWHIECSAMSCKYLGSSFDIHGGGIDLLFPHHENERAQTMAAFSCSHMANIWMHNEFINCDTNKMSKSLGNVVTIQEILNQFPGEVLRLFILLTQYRHPINFLFSHLETAKNILDKLYNALRHTKVDHLNDTVVTLQLALNCKEEFLLALQDDLNTPLAIQVMQRVGGYINKTSDIRERRDLVKVLYYCGRLLGVLQHNPVEWFTSSSAIDEAQIEFLIAQRKQAKEKKDYVLADTIRDKLLQQGIVLEDSIDNTIWRKK